MTKYWIFMTKDQYRTNRYNNSMSDVDWMRTKYVKFFVQVRTVVWKVVDVKLSRDRPSWQNGGHGEERGDGGTLRPTKRKFVRSTNASGRATKRQVDSLFICVHSSIDILLFLILPTWKLAFVVNIFCITLSISLKIKM